MEFIWSLCGLISFFWQNIAEYYSTCIAFRVVPYKNHSPIFGWIMVDSKLGMARSQFCLSLSQCSVAIQLSELFIYIYIMYTYIFIHIICMIVYNRTIYMICLVIIQITHCKLAKKCVDTYGYLRPPCCFCKAGISICSFCKKRGTKLVPTFQLLQMFLKH